LVRLCVNVDHVATLRQARRGTEPDPVQAAALAELAGADGITVHLREDRRHIQDRDLFLLRKKVKTKLNLEMAVEKEIIEIALSVRPDQVTFVPERREEITTEGGLDVASQKKKIADAVRKFHKNKIAVSLFIDPLRKQIDAAVQVGAKIIEINTGRYSEARSEGERVREIQKIRSAVRYARSRKLTVNAGHGLNSRNVRKIVEIPGIEELNIGHSIVANSILAGLSPSVRRLLALLR
jgi:pyridoxine 5-phosphate synthase